MIDSVSLRQLLFVTYYFPPAGGPGVQRTLKFVKYLREYGWNPVLLVPKDPEYQARDESLVNELPTDLTIYRAPIFEPYDLYRKFTGKPKGVSLDVNVIKEEGAARSTSERIAELIRGTLFIPDARIGWLPAAINEGRKVIAEQRRIGRPIEAIYSSSPPYTPALIARRLSKFAQVPWVAGFRDPWTGFHNTPDRWFLPAAIDRYLEHAVFSDATRVEVAWKGIADDARAKYHDLPAEKFIHIPNGFDSQDFPERDIRKRAELPNNEKFTITYSGSLYGPRNPLSFLKAIELLIGEGKVDPAKMHLRFVGRFGGEIHEMLARPMIAPMVEKLDYVPHARAVEILLATDALLLIVDDVPTVASIVPGKVYEYLGAMRPLIAIAPTTSAIAELLEETNAGAAADQSDIPAQANLILALYQDWNARKNGVGSAPHFAMRPEVIERYDRRVETRTLARLLDEVATKK